MNLADNTYAITYDEWAGGDMVLMDWNQTEEPPNFGGREVWHTYLIGKPDEVIYYGNETGDPPQPLPVTRVTGGSRMDMVRTHPDRHGHSPRRYLMLRGKIWGPRSDREVADVIRVRTSLNLRAGPGLDQEVLESARRGDRFEVLGREGVWLHLRLPDGRDAWGHSYFLQTHREPIEGEEAGGLTAGLASR
jgi:hypothetical protein